MLNKISKNSKKILKNRLFTNYFEKIKGENMVDNKKCITCGACMSICPVNAISIVDGKAQIDPKKCIKCGSCAQFCPVGAITIQK